MITRIINNSQRSRRLTAFTTSFATVIGTTGKPWIFIYNQTGSASWDSMSRYAEAVSPSE
jgi:hypothetical protein